MAYPWLQEETFDDGTRGNFDATTDASSLLSFPTYIALAQQGLAPWRGAHALKVALKGNATGYIQENTGFNVNTGSTLALWLPVCIGSDLVLNAGDAVILLAAQSAGPVNEVVFGVQNNGGTYQLFAGQAGATNTINIVPNSKVTYQVELVAALNAGAGTLDFYVNGGAVGSQITGLTNANIAQLRLGAVSGTAGGDAGTIVIGGIIGDDLRVYPRERFPLNSFWITRDMHAFVGKGTIHRVELTGTSTDAILTILDTDQYSGTGITFSREPKVYVRNTTANADSPTQAIGPIMITNGAYVQLTGTNPQAWIFMQDEGGSYVKSHDMYTQRGLRR